MNAEIAEMHKSDLILSIGLLLRKANDKDTVPVESLDCKRIHNCTTELYLSQTADKSSSILWLDEQTRYSYTSDGYLSEEELIQMTKSISQKKQKNAVLCDRITF